jgi:hypothetical protein
VKQYVVVLRPGRLGFASATASDTCKAMSDQHIGPSGGIVEFYHANSGSTRQWSPSPFHARIFHSIPQHHHSKLFMHQSMCERPCPETRFWAPRPVAALTPKSAPWSSWRWGGFICCYGTCTSKPHVTTPSCKPGCCHLPPTAPRDAFVMSTPGSQPLKTRASRLVTVLQIYICKSAASCAASVQPPNLLNSLHKPAINHAL